MGFLKKNFCHFLSTLINSIHVNHVFNGLTHTNRCGATWSCFQCRLPPKLPLPLRFHFINLSTLFERVRDFIHLRCPLCLAAGGGKLIDDFLVDFRVQIPLASLLIQLFDTIYLCFDILVDFREPIIFSIYMLQFKSNKRT